jgi:hypothetical protein
MALETLRILSETAASLRATPDSPAALRRRDEAIRFAARNDHSLEEIAAAADLPPEQVDTILSAPVGGGIADSPLLRVRFRGSPAGASEA